jgi:1-acyl-sn-glycerol-3-phosphate acyltransferase
LAGTEHIPVGRAAVYCANHESNVDPPILFDKLVPRMHIVYKSEINAIPLLARAFRHGGFVPIDRRNPRSARKRTTSALTPSPRKTARRSST